MSALFVNYFRNMFVICIKYKKNVIEKLESIVKLGFLASFPMFKSPKLLINYIGKYVNVKKIIKYF